MDHGTLFVVATPIGNRDDLAPRARRILSEVDLIAAEDTRHTGRLLSHFGIKTELMALHEHNEAAQTEGLVGLMKAGKSVALVSDAGTPLISDPGYRLVSAAHDGGLTVSPVPGPSAVISALSAAGLPTDRFAFEGFLPAKAAARRALLASLRQESRTLVFLESVHKIRETLPDLVEALGRDRLAFVGREMTKLHEQCRRAPLAELAAMLDDGSIVAKGEFVLVIDGAEQEDPPAGSLSADALLKELMPLLPGKQAVDVVARVTGRRRNDIYRDMLALKDSGPDD